jgi:hypothetical protein
MSSPTPWPRATLSATPSRRGHWAHVVTLLDRSALAHLPSGDFTANSAWVACAVIAYNLTRPAGTLAGCPQRASQVDELRSRR